MWKTIKGRRFFVPENQSEEMMAKHMNEFQKIHPKGSKNIRLNKKMRSKWKQRKR